MSLMDMTLREIIEMFDKNISFNNSESIPVSDDAMDFIFDDDMEMLKIESRGSLTDYDD